MRTNIGGIGLGKTKITSLLAAELDQLVNACVVFLCRLRGPYIVVTFSSLSIMHHGSSADLLNLAVPFLQYTDNVVGAGSPKYDQAYFEVNYLRAYTTGSPTPTPTGVGGLRGAGSTALPSQQNAGVSSYFQSLWLPSLGVIASLPLFCDLW